MQQALLLSSDNVDTRSAPINDRGAAGLNGRACNAVNGVSTGVAIGKRASKSSEPEEK